MKIHIYLKSIQTEKSNCYKLLNIRKLVLNTTYYEKLIIGG